MVVIFIVTLGLYVPAWFLRRRAALNRLDSPKKLQLWPFVLYCVYVVVEFVTTFISEYDPDSWANDPNVAASVRGVRLMASIAMIVQGFAVKTILEDHLAGPDDDVSPSLTDERVQLSAIMTFFFHIFYLQWASNRYIVDGRQAEVGVASVSS